MYRVEMIPTDSDQWINFMFLAGDSKGVERRCRLGWNGARFGRCKALDAAARRSPYELEALTEWLEAGRP